MIVCVCANVSERKLRATIAGGATTPREIERRCGAGAGCGECRVLVRECLRQCQAEAASASGTGSHLTVTATPAPAPA
jgi:bacterioferritin-associated ferredoxin